MTDNRKPRPERMFDSGFTDLIPVIPPGAALTPSSKIPQESVGKTPGLRASNGLWYGMDWRKTVCTAESVREWTRWGSNIGLRTDLFPCVDIDIADARLARSVEVAAIHILGPAPIRTGNAPKRALAYRLADGQPPFGRLRLWMKRGDEKKFLIEVLGSGQQYVVHGTHPTTQLPYHWDIEPVASELTPITLDKAKEFLTAVEEAAHILGLDCEREGDGRPLATRVGDQTGLLAPSMEALRQVVDILPNTDVIAPGRNEWLKIGAAIRAAAGEAEEREAANLFVAWSMKWEGNDRSAGNDPADTEANFRRIKPPFSVGWSLLADLARPYGFDDSTFDTEEPDTAKDTTPTPVESVRTPVYLSDQWLAARVVKALLGVMRFVPSKGIWIVWNNGTWRPDAELLAEDMIKMEMRNIAAEHVARPASEGEMKAAMKQGVDICSSNRLSAVMRFVKVDRAIAVAVDSLDHDQWILNTPAGIVDLTTGALLPPDPDQLCTRSTSVTPEYGPAPIWEKFLHEATAGDAELAGYMQRLAGYCLTGSTREQQFSFIHGNGGNGKGTFITAMTDILDGYHRDSPMDTFTASSNDRHPTELASLSGARFVTAQETQAGKRWDEAKIKLLTGGDKVTARAMRQDFFTFQPHFKLVFSGNHRPDIRDLDRGMKRRLHMVPFTHAPKFDDKMLGEKLKAEYPQILGWMVEGCLAWQRDGLCPPPVVQDATAEYFKESDPVGQWLTECTDRVPGSWLPLMDLFRSWVEYANRHGHHAGHSNRFSRLLESHGVKKRPNPDTRRVEFGGVKLLPAHHLEGMTV